mgnify:CR=1 FL=1
MIIISIFSVLGQALLFILFKICYLLSLISKKTYNKFIIWMIKTNGPVSIKVFQVLSSSDDFKKIAGDDLIKRIIKLQDQVYPHRRRFINKFKYKSKKPIATGTIGQVYLVDLPENKEGILKVTHSYVDNEILNSVEKLKIAKNLSKYFVPKLYNFLKYLNFNEFKSFLLLQTDFNYEYKNIKTFTSIFQDNDLVIIPKVIKHSKKYILMSKEEGYKINDFFNKYPDFKDEAVALLYSCLYKMVNNKTLHGDLHFGNFLFKLVDNEVRITLLDYGIICYLDENQSNYLLNFMKKKSNKKENKINLINFVESLLIENNNINLNNFNIIYKNNQEILKKSSSEIINLILKDKNIQLPSNFLSLFTTLKIVLDLQKTCKKTNPDFDNFLAGYMMENDFDI